MNAVTTLLVEDDAPLRDLIGLAIERLLGYTVISAANAAEAMELFQEYHPLFLVLDILLPQTNGLDFLRQLKEKNLLENTFAIVISALGYPEVVQQAAACGARDFLVKPFDVEYLISRLQQAQRKAE